MRVALIAAVAKNGVIGSDGVIPWRLPGDLKHFKEITMGKPLVMGRRTYESIGYPLPGRFNIVLSRNKSFLAGGVTVTHDLNYAFKIAEDEASKSEVEEIMVIGGSKIYRETMPLAQRLYITEIHNTFDGDVTFPKINPIKWKELSRLHVSSDKNETCDYSFVVLDRVIT